MLFIISLAVMVLLVSGTVWLRNKWIIDTFNSYGVYGNMAGLYLYKKYGLWFIGNSQEDSVKEVEKEPSLIIVRKLDLEPGLTR